MLQLRLQGVVRGAAIVVGEADKIYSRNLARTGTSSTALTNVTIDEKIPSEVTHITHFRQPVWPELPLCCQVVLMKHLVLEVRVHCKQIRESAQGGKRDDRSGQK